MRKSDVFFSIILVVILSLGLIGGCNNSGSGDNSGENEPVLGFTDITFNAGLNYSHGFVGPFAGNEQQLISGGVAAGDYDNDGWVDLYIVSGANGPNLLFRNNGNGTFTEVGQNAGLDISGVVGSGPTFADISGDGFLDLFIGVISETIGCACVTEPSFYLNNGDGTFTNISSPLIGAEYSSRNTFSAAFGDYDLDNDLDMFITHWLGGGSTASSDHLWRNNGDNTFTDVSIASGIADTYDHIPDYTFTPNFADINNDGYPDLLIASDFLTSQVFINQQDGTFLNTTDTEVITDENGMGAAVGDYDNDGDLDWFVSSIYGVAGLDQTGNRLYRNKGDGTFEDVTYSAGVEHGFWGWGSCMYDFDNDGNLDIAHVNGWGFTATPITEAYFFDPTRLFMSNGDGTFTEKALELGLNDTGQGRGLVCFDFDRDGDIDLFIANNNQPPKLFRNDFGNQNNFLSVKLNGLAPNTEGVGARVIVTTGTDEQMRELRAGSNFVSQNPVIAHFGLGNTDIVDQVMVKWPDGQISILENVTSNQFLEINHPLL